MMIGGGLLVALQLAAIMLGASWFFVSQLNAESAILVATKREHNAMVLNRAKKALIGYVAAQAAKAGETDRFHEVFEVRLSGDEAQAALVQLKQIAQIEKTCMMCLESEPEHCHRILICEALQRDGVEIRHLIEPDLFRRVGAR